MPYPDNDGDESQVASQIERPPYKPNEFSLYLLQQVLGWINKLFTESLQTPHESQDKQWSQCEKCDGLLL